MLTVLVMAASLHSKENLETVFLLSFQDSAPSRSRGGWLGAGRSRPAVQWDGVWHCTKVQIQGPWKNSHHALGSAQADWNPQQISEKTFQKYVFTLPHEHLRKKTKPERHQFLLAGETFLCSVPMKTQPNCVMKTHTARIRGLDKGEC